MKSLAQSVLYTGLAMLCGLAIVLMLGVWSWSTVRGLPGIGIGMLVATVTAVGLRQFKHPSSVIASGLGGALASYLAIACAEMYVPGSIEWIWKGGLYAALIALPFTAFLSPLVLIKTGLRTR